MGGIIKIRAVSYIGTSTGSYIIGLMMHPARIWEHEVARSGKIPKDLRVTHVNSKPFTPLVAAPPPAADYDSLLTYAAPTTSPEAKAEDSAAAPLNILRSVSSTISETLYHHLRL
jgi:hypothetical protein